jgi:anthranilate synthase component I
MKQPLSLDEFKMLAKEAKQVAVFQEIPAGTFTPAAIYSVLRKAYKTDGVMLEDLLQRECPRYSFICFEPIASLKINNGDHRHPLTALRTLQSQLTYSTRPEAADLITNAIGFITYDAIRYFEEIPDRHSVHPSLPLLLFNFYALSLTFDHEKQTILISTLVEVGDQQEEVYNEAQKKILAIKKLLSTAIREDDRLSLDRKEADRRSLDRKKDAAFSLDRKEADGRSLDRKEADGRFLDRKEADGRPLDRKEADGRFLDRKEADGRFLDRKEADGRSLDRKEADGRSLNQKEADGRSLNQKEDQARSLDRHVTSLVEVEPSDSDFMRMVEKAREYIIRGDAFQIVLSRCFKRHYSASPFDIYKTLRQVSPAPYMFYFPIGSSVIIGASPEQFIRVHNKQVMVNPIAGTRRRTGERTDEVIEDDLLTDKKELAEHMMLVDLARNDVGAVSEPGSVKVSELLNVKHYSHVSHITSTVTGKLKEEYDALDAFAAAFPAGTLSGAPKIRAMHIIDELETSRRGLYGGTICRLDLLGNFDSCIAIRAAILDNGIATVRTGAGIIYDSNPANEVQETYQKAQSILDAIACAEGELDTIAQTQTEVDSIAQAQTEVDTIAQAQTEVDTIAQAQTEVDTIAQAQTEVDTIAQAQTEVDTIAQAQGE